MQPYEQSVFFLVVSLVFWLHFYITVAKLILYSAYENTVHEILHRLGLHDHEFRPWWLV